MKQIIFTLSILITTTIYAQNVEFTIDNFKDNKDGLKEAKKNISIGDLIYEQDTAFYKQALEPYLKAYQFNPNNALLNYKIGKCYLYSNYKLKSIPYLEKAYSLDPAVDKQIHYFLGRAYHLNMQWDKAIEEFKIYVQILKPAAGGGSDSDSEKHIQECLNGKELVKNPIRVYVTNVGPEINTQYPEYLPSISADESVMMFTSRRPTGISGEELYLDGGYMENIYISTKIDGKWTTALNMGKPVNTDKNNANSGISADGQNLLIYRGENNGDLYESHLKGENWSKPEHLNNNINTKEYHESSGCYSPDGKSIYFISDKPKGFGGRDIYVSTKDEKGDWGKSVNLGPAINTPYDEEGVFMHPDGKTLYFSSKGHEGMGGYDIFKSVYDEKTNIWSEPKSLGYPINTTDDDVFFVTSANGKHGYYSSFKDNGYGEKDIYMIRFLGAEKQPVLNSEDNLLASKAQPITDIVVTPIIQIEEAQLIVLKGVITDELTQKTLEATIDIIDNEKDELIATFVSNSSTGKYLVTLPAGKNYGIAVKKDGYLFHSENFDIPNTASFQEVIKNVALKSISVGSKIILKNIFFDFDKATLRPQSANELARLKELLKNVPTLKIEISGHTDSKGAYDYNQKLSENRAKAVVDYLVKAGIASDRLVYKGYGKEQPIATNDTEAGRQLNRRTEFKILSK